MKLDFAILSTLELMAGPQRGVLTIKDVEILFNTVNRQLLAKRLAPYILAKVIVRFCRGLYIYPRSFRDPQKGLLYLSQRIVPDSMISLGTALSIHRMIGSVPLRTVYAVKIGTSRTYENAEIGRIVHLGFGNVSDGDFMGLGSVREGGINLATPERALLDTLYFYQRGRVPFFNIYSDIFTIAVNKKRYLEYLENYPNARFRAFARSYINERSDNNNK